MEAVNIGVVFLVVIIFFMFQQTQLHRTNHMIENTHIKNKMSNNVSFVIDKNTNQNFRFHFKVMNLDKILISNYRVRVSSKNICELVSKEIPLTYWIALEENSYFVSVKGDKTNA